MQMKDSYIRLRVDSQTKRQLEQLAARHSLSVSELLRRGGLAYGRGRDPEIERQILEELVRIREAVGRAGNNLNQIAKKMNRGAKVPAPYMEKVATWSDAVTARLNAALDERKPR